MSESTCPKKQEQETETSKPKDFGGIEFEFVGKSRPEVVRPKEKKKLDYEYKYPKRSVQELLDLVYGEDEVDYFNEFDECHDL